MGNPIIIPVQAHVVTAVTRVDAIETVMVDQGKLRPPLANKRRVSHDEVIFRATASEAKLRQYLIEASAIWKQADVGFSLTSYEACNSQAPAGATPGAKVDESWTTLLAREFPSQNGAISLILVQRMDGAAGESDDKTRTTVLDENAGGALVAHEFGHLMGLCPDPNKHDPRRDNLMYFNMPYMNAKLDATQCRSARASPLAVRFGARP